MHSRGFSRMHRCALFTLVLAAVVALGGVARIGETVSAQDGEVGTEAIRDPFQNPTPIDIPGQGQAAPYPSTILVANLPQRLYDVDVELRGFTHAHPDDVDVMLEAPNGATAVIMADAGGSSAVSDLDIVLNDETTDGLPDSGELKSASYKPRNHTGGDEFTTANVLLGTFDGINPNGEWKLYVRDDRSGSRGEIINGWRLQILYGEAPRATDDSYTTRQDRRLEVSARRGVLANDTDGDPETGVETQLTASLKDGPNKGTVRLRSDGSFVYKPKAGERGTDEFTYTVRDGDGLTDTGLVRITIERR
jgi:subtilisin-like proprotein convertase family protein